MLSNCVATLNGISLFFSTKNENEGPPQPALAEMSAEAQLQLMHNRPRVAILSDVSQKLLQLSRLEHDQMTERMDRFLVADCKMMAETERDRTFLREALVQNLRAMQSAVAMMEDMNDILLRLTTGVTPAKRPQRPSILAENSQPSTEFISPSQDSLAQLQFADSDSVQNPQDNMCGQYAARGCPQEWKCHGQKHDHYSP